MAAKQGILEKLKLCSYFLFNKTKRNVLVNNYEFCGSTNIIAENKKQVTNGEFKNYTAKYVCKSCGAQGITTQNWIKPEVK